MSTPAAAVLAAAAPRPAAAPGLDRRVLVGLCGVLLAVLVSGFNENITKVALADIRGAMGFSVDDGSWIVALYSAMSVLSLIHI